MDHQTEEGRLWSLPGPVLQTSGEITLLILVTP